MGLFSGIKRSAEKSKKMRNLINAIDWEGPKYGMVDAQVVFDDFYEYISNDIYLKPIIDNHNVSKTEMLEYMEKLRWKGFGWSGSAYIPVSSFGFPNTLDYVLGAIENDDDVFMVGLELTNMLKL